MCVKDVLILSRSSIEKEMRFCWRGGDLTEITFSVEDGILVAWSLSDHLTLGVHNKGVTGKMHDLLSPHAVH